MAGSAAAQQLRTLPCRLLGHLLLLLLPLLPSLAEATTQRMVYWNSSNPVFKPAGENSLTVQLQDQVMFMCPSDGAEFYQIYWTNSRSQAQACSGGSLLFSCRRMTSYLVIVQIFPADPTAPGFNNPVYFYTPSNGSLLGLDQKEGGACRTRNMRLTVRMADSPATSLAEAGQDGSLAEGQRPRPSTASASASSAAASSASASGAAGPPRQTSVGRQQTTGTNSGMVSSRGPMEEDRVLDPYQLNLITGGTVARAYLTTVAAMSCLTAFVTGWLCHVL